MGPEHRCRAQSGRVAPGHGTRGNSHSRLRDGATRATALSGGVGGALTTRYIPGRFWQKNAEPKLAPPHPEPSGVRGASAMR